MKYFKETRVISRNAITDFVQGIRNTLGLKLIAYAKGIEETTEQLESKYLRGKSVKR